MGGGASPDQKGAMRVGQQTSSAVGGRRTPIGHTTRSGEEGRGGYFNLGPIYGTPQSCCFAMDVMTQPLVELNYSTHISGMGNADL